MKRTYILMAIALLAALAPGAARADEMMLYEKGTWPLRVVDRPLTLAGDMIEIRGDTFRMDLGAGSAGSIMTLAPDLYYGVNDDLVLGVDHREGICIGGCSGYRDVALTVLYSLLRGGAFELAMHDSLAAVSVEEPSQIGVELGFLARLKLGSWAVVMDPRVYIGVVGRDYRSERLEVPVQLQYQVQDQTALIMSAGFNGPVSGFGSALEIPIGIAGLFAINNRIDLGVELQLADVMADEPLAGRWLIGRLALRI